MSVFDALLGQNQAVNVLQEAAASSRTPKTDSQKMTHSWLFTGPPGSGRSNAAIAFAQALICPNDACGECSECKSAKTSGHPDVEILHTEGLHIKVEQVRELLSRAAWAPSTSGRRVIVIEDADRLTDSAANALLKAIEEPGLRTVWLLCAPTLQDVIPTLRSRCRHIQLQTPPTAEIAKSLIHQCHAEPLLAELAARASFGHVGRARHLATSQAARENRRIILEIPFQLESVATTFRAAQKIIEIANIEASTKFENQNEKELSKIQEVYGKGFTGRGLVSGGNKAIRELEKEQKSRASRMIVDSVDGNLLLIATFFRDVMRMQIDSGESIINIDIRDQIDHYARKTTLHSTVGKFGAILDARLALINQASPLLTCEALMCQLARGNSVKTID